MTRLNSLVLALMLSLTLGVPAARAAPVGEWYDYISKVHITSDGYLQINVLGNYRPSHGCRNLAYARSVLPISLPQIQAFMQIAMASFLSRAKVYVITDGCYGTAGAEYPKLISIQISQ